MQHQQVAQGPTGESLNMQPNAPPLHMQAVGDIRNRPEMMQGQQVHAQRPMLPPLVQPDLEFRHPANHPQLMAPHPTRPTSMPHPGASLSQLGSPMPAPRIAMSSSRPPLNFQDMQYMSPPSGCYLPQSASLPHFPPQMQQPGPSTQWSSFVLPSQDSDCRNHSGVFPAMVTPGSIQQPTNCDPFAGVPVIQQNSEPTQRPEITCTARMPGNYKQASAPVFPPCLDHTRPPSTSRGKRRLTRVPGIPPIGGDMQPLPTPNDVPITMTNTAQTRIPEIPPIVDMRPPPKPVTTSIPLGYESQTNIPATPSSFDKTQTPIAPGCVPMPMANNRLTGIPGTPANCHDIQSSPIPRSIGMHSGNNCRTAPTVVRPVCENIQCPSALMNLLVPRNGGQQVTIPDIPPNINDIRSPPTPGGVKMNTSKRQASGPPNLDYKRLPIPGNYKQASAPVFPPSLDHTRLPSTSGCAAIPKSNQLHLIAPGIPPVNGDIQPKQTSCSVPVKMTNTQIFDMPHPSMGSQLHNIFPAGAGAVRPDCKTTPSLSTLMNFPVPINDSRQNSISEIPPVITGIPRNPTTFHCIRTPPTPDDVRMPATSMPTGYEPHTEILATSSSFDGIQPTLTPGYASLPLANNRQADIPRNATVFNDLRPPPTPSGVRMTARKQQASGPPNFGFMSPPPTPCNSLQGDGQSVMSGFSNGPLSLQKKNRSFQPNEVSSTSIYENITSISSPLPPPTQIPQNLELTSRPQVNTGHDVDVKDSHWMPTCKIQNTHPPAEGINPSMNRILPPEKVGPGDTPASEPQVNIEPESKKAKKELDYLAFPEDLVDFVLERGGGTGIDCQAPASLVIKQMEASFRRLCGEFDL